MSSSRTTGCTGVSDSLCASVGGKGVWCVCGCVCVCGCGCGWVGVGGWGRGVGLNRWVVMCVQGGCVCHQAENQAAQVRGDVFVFRNEGGLVDGMVVMCVWGGGDQVGQGHACQLVEAEGCERLTASYRSPFQTIGTVLE
jgi:hypothetical protein